MDEGSQDQPAAAGTAAPLKRGRDVDGAGPASPSCAACQCDTTPPSKKSRTKTSKTRIIAPHLHQAFKQWRSSLIGVVIDDRSVVRNAATMHEIQVEMTNADRSAVQQLLL